MKLGRPKGIPSKRKGKTFEEFFGREQAQKIKRKLSLSKSQPEQKTISSKNLSKYLRTHPPHNKGKTKNNYEPLKKVSEKMKGKPKSAEHRKNLSEAGKGINKGRTYEEMYGESHAQKIKELRRIVLINTRKDMAQNGFVSTPQKRLFAIVKEIFPNAEMEYPIRTRYGVRFADVAVLSHRLDLEMDGHYWHRDDDDQRDKELCEVNWTVIHFSDLESEEIWRERLGI